MNNEITPFESIRRTNPAGNEFWSSRDFARVLGCVNYRHFQAVIEKARTACLNSGQRWTIISSESTICSKSARERSARRSP
jgi:hypothetical protein